ncbi:MAG: nucleotidyl transferase [candidate division Zixibacteria bacterium SM1_73]|nr:MAG: nucleotidyl transferase [candidate division Zixibacteria bacterium SM1_73]
MKVIIPVAGIGTRLRPHTHTAPKGLLHVAGKPILGHILDALKQVKIDEMIFIVGFMGEQIVEYVSKNYKFKSKFIYQKELKGLGYAIWLASSEIKNNEPVLIVLGDTIFEADLSPVLKGKFDALGTKRVENPRRFGIVEMEKGFARKLVEKPDKPTSNLAVVGVYYITNTEAFKESLEEIIKKQIMTKNEYQLTDALQRMIDKGVKFRTFEITGWYDCGKVETLLQTNRHLLSKIKSIRRLKGSVIIPPVFISKTAMVKSSILGPYVSVAHKAVIENSIIRDSIISERAVVNNSRLESSLIGNNAEVNGVFHQLNVGDSSEVGYSGF